MTLERLRSLAMRTALDGITHGRHGGEVAVDPFRDGSFRVGIVEVPAGVVLSKACWQLLLKKNPRYTKIGIGLSVNDCQNT